MHQLIATYLFQNKQCPLHGLGYLYISTSAAQTNFLNKQIDAPQQQIKFSAQQTDDNGFINYLAKQKSVSFDVAKTQFTDFANTILSLPHYSINGIGNFGTADNAVSFEAFSLPSEFLPSAHAERVIHEAAEHNMLVGDKETTTTQMTEYYADTSVVKDRWWIWTIILGFGGIAAILFYYFVLNPA